jgi:hypothetical protein
VPPRLAALLGAAVLAVSLLAGCNERPTADNVAFHSDVVNHRSGAEVTMIGIDSGEPQQVGDHEHLILLVPTGERVEVDHNTQLSQWVPAHDRDDVTVHGQLYIDPGSVGIHCTHARTSSGCPQPGWIGLNGTYYE